MSNESKSGQVTWRDLTVGDAVAIRDFYEQVVGWKHQAVDMGDYEDFCMQAANGDVVAGVCHARGENAGLPNVWLAYVNVDDIAGSIEACETLGGKLINGPRKAGGGMCAIIEDPTGAAIGLFQAD